MGASVQALAAGCCRVAGMAENARERGQEGTKREKSNRGNNVVREGRLEGATPEPGVDVPCRVMEDLCWN